MSVPSIETAKNSIYSGRARKVRSFTIRLLLSQLETTLSSLQQIKERIEKILSPKDESGSILGVGKGTLAIFLAIAGQRGDFFPSAKKLIGYLGFDPQIYQSGQKRRGNIISHQGPNYVRKGAYMGAVSCIRHNTGMRTLYNKKVSQGKTHKQALIYVAKKLSQMILSMLKTGELYQPGRVFISPTALPCFGEKIPAYF